MADQGNPLNINMRQEDTLGCFATQSAINISKDGFAALTFLTEEPFSFDTDNRQAVVAARVYMPIPALAAFLEMAQRTLDEATASDSTKGDGE